MIGGKNLAGFVAVFMALAAGQGLGQQVASSLQDPPPAQQPPAQQAGQPPAQQPAGQQQQPLSKGPLKPNELDPNGKVSDIPDPTKDPTKDPKNDITKDPTKDPDKVMGDAPEGDAAGGGGAGALGADAPDYTGPAILSRGFALSRPAIPVNQPLRFYAGLNADYDSGLLGAYVQNGATAPSIPSEGWDVNWGASMRKYHRRSIMDFNYSGDYYKYYSNTKSGGQNHSLAAGFTQQISPRFSVGLRETGGLTSNNYSILNSTPIYDVSLNSGTIVVAPNTEAFADRTYYSTTSGSATYQMTARLSFSVNGAYFLVNRDSQYLANTRGYSTGGDISYRITRRQTVGIFYSHSEYSYTKIFGGSNADSVGVNYSISLNRTTDLSFSGGGTRYDSQALDTVTPNPLVQAVLGIQSGIEKDYFLGYAPDIAASLSRRLRNSSFGVTFSEGITPGNGLILTSRSQSESVFWTLPTFHKWAAQVGGGRSNLSGYANGAGTAGSYASYYARFSLSRPVTRVISSYFNLDFRDYGFGGGNTFHQTEVAVSIGFRFSPGEGPIKLW